MNSTFKNTTKDATTTAQTESVLVASFKLFREYMISNFGRNGRWLRTRFNESHCAKALGMSRTTFRARKQAWHKNNLIEISADYIRLVKPKRETRMTISTFEELKMISAEKTQRAPLSTGKAAKKMRNFAHELELYIESAIHARAKEQNWNEAQIRKAIGKWKGSSKHLTSHNYFISVRAIAARFNKSVGTIHNWLKWLENNKLISIQRRGKILGEAISFDSTRAEHSKVAHRTFNMRVNGTWAKVERLISSYSFHPDAIASSTKKVHFCN